MVARKVAEFLDLELQNLVGYEPPFLSQAEKEGKPSLLSPPDGNAILSKISDDKVELDIPPKGWGMSERPYLLFSLLWPARTDVCLKIVLRPACWLGFVEATVQIVLMPIGRKTL